MERSYQPSFEGSPANLLEASDEDLLLEEQLILQGADRAFHLGIQADLAFMGLILAAERRNVPVSEGYSSTEEWVCTRYGITYGNACVKVSAARCLRELHLIREAYRQGRISWDHVRALIEVAGADTEQGLLAECEGMSAGDTWKMVINIKKVSAKDSSQAQEARFLEKWWDIESRQLMFNGQLPEDLGTRFEKALDAIVDSLPKDPGASIEQRRADALVEMASGSSIDRPDRALVVVHVDKQDLEAEDGNAQIEDGPSTSISAVKRLMCDSHVQLIVHGEDGQPIGVGKRTRSVPRWLRRQLTRRDKTCRFGTCNRRYQLEAHHVTHYPDGPTDYDNLVLLCRFHHDKVHHEEWELQGQAPKISFRRKDGSMVKMGPPKVQPEVVPLFNKEFFKSWGAGRDPTPGTS